MNKQKREIKVHNDTYTINFVDKNDKELVIAGNDSHWGVIRFENRGIYIRNDLDDQTSKGVIIHELVHAFVESGGFGQVNWNEEIVADFFECYFHDMQAILQTID